MEKLLWISLCPPYDKSPHAGGQNINYYLKRVSSEDTFDLTVVSFYSESEYKNLDLEYYRINSFLFQSEPRSNLVRLLNTLEKKYSILNPYANFCDLYKANCIRTQLKKIQKLNYIPNKIILHWTQMTLLIDVIKDIFPDSKIISIEEDVAYLGIKRKRDYVDGRILKFLYGIKFNRLFKQEIMCLNKSDLIFVTNKKDKRLLIEQNVSKPIINIVPYYHNMLAYPRNYNGNKNIIFFGAMNREENYLSVIWFIEKVMPLLDKDYKLLIIGGNPNDILENYVSDRVQLLGYVQDISIYFSTALCLVAPLVLGAGIKIKILEAMSSGIPVLTNNIGIEGIDAVDKHDFFYCNSPEEYVDGINTLYLNNNLNKEIGDNAKEYIENNFNIENSFWNLITQITSL